MVSLSSDAQVLSMVRAGQKNTRAEIIQFSLVILMAMAGNLLITFALHKDHMEQEENKDAEKTCDMKRNPHQV